MLSSGSRECIKLGNTLGNTLGNSDSILSSKESNEFSLYVEKQGSFVFTTKHLDNESLTTTTKLHLSITKFRWHNYYKSYFFKAISNTNIQHVRKYYE